MNTKIYKTEIKTLTNVLSAPDKTDFPIRPLEPFAELVVPFSVYSWYANLSVRVHNSANGSVHLGTNLVSSRTFQKWTYYKQYKYVIYYIILLFVPIKSIGLLLLCKGVKAPDFTRDVILRLWRYYVGCVKL